MFVAICARSIPSDKNVADPHCASADPLKRTLVVDAPNSVWCFVVEVDTLFKVLFCVCEVESEQLTIGTVTREVYRRVHPNHFAAERHNDVAESRASIAPTIADEPAPAPVPTAQPAPQPTPQPRLDRPVAATTPAPADARTRRRPDRAIAQPKAATRAGGGSRVGDNFLAGMGDSTRTAETRAPAAALGASARASLLQGIVREVKPHWQPPSGPDVDQLVSKIRFRLNQDGSLAGRPTMVSQRGENATNRAQAGRHGEQAIRAVQLAAPFDLPEQHYSAWKTVTLDFDWKLAQ